MHPRLRLVVPAIAAALACVVSGPAIAATPTPPASPTPTATPSPTGSPTSSPSPSPSPTPKGVINGPDVASYQHPGGKAINWRKVARDGKDFAIVKATEGTSYTNPYFATDYIGSRTAGLVHGAYHFARPAHPIVGNATAQAEYFASRVGDVATTATLPPALDLEVTGGLSRADLVTWAQTFLYRLRTLTGRTPMLYTYPSFWTGTLADPSAFARFPLWMASYCPPPRSRCQPGAADLWQYTSSASIDGISGGVDESRYLGTASGLPWSTLSDGTVAVPWLATAPRPPHSLSVTPGPTTATVSWVPGNDGSNRTTRYVITSDPGDVTARVGGGHTSATVTGLDPTTSYTFTVKARSSAGTGKPSSPTAAITPIVSTELSATQPTRIRYGKALTISAELIRSDTQAPVAGQDLTVYRRGVGRKAWHQRTTITTGSDGVATVTLHPKHSLQVKVAFAGAPGYRPVAEASTTRLQQIVTASLSHSTVKHRHHVRLTGAVSPVVAGQQVTREVRTSKGWRAQLTKAVRTDGTYSFRLHPMHKGTVRRYRVVVAAIGGYAGGHSPAATLTVT